MRTLIYQLTNITADGKPCSAEGGKPVVEFEEISPCVAIVCYYPNENKVELSIDDSDPNCKKCFRVSIKCAGCNNCEPVVKEICLCGPDNVCPPCYICVDGKCIPKCPDKACDPNIGDCVECDKDHPCPCNQQCIQGKCVCPPGQVKDEKGCCVDCLPGQVHPENKCIICEGGKWATKECPDGKCNPLTGECDQCVGKEDCKESNQCCEGGKCVCCPGYVLDPISKQCVPKPKCGPDTPCPNCQVCENGNCVPVKCPEGYSPVWNEDKKICECLPTCDCDRPDCQNPEHTCADRNKDGQCNCYGCGNKPCDANNPCPEGCKCVDGICVKDNCGNPCENGLNCAPGCGCDPKTKTCVDCKANPDALGCKDGCSGGCESKEDCNTGCTCHNQECVDCSNFSCDTNECAQKLGCKCVNGKCVGDPDYCKDTFVAEAKPCKIESTLTMNLGCACPVITALIFPANGEIIYTTPNPNGNVEPQKVTLNLAVRLVKGLGKSWELAKALPRLKDISNENIAHNEMPTAGTITFKVTTRVQYYSYNPTTKVWVKTTVGDKPVQEYGASFTNSDQVIIQNVRLEKVNQFFATTSLTGYEVISHKIEAEVSAAFKFDNGCEYKAVQKLGSQVLGTDFNTFYDQFYDGAKRDNFYYEGTGNADLSETIHLFNKITSASGRNPLFKWYRSEDSVYTADDIIRKIYIQPDAPSTYKDGLLGPKMFDPAWKQNLNAPEGRLLGDMYYKVVNDCSCKDKEVDLGRVRFCDPTVPFAASDYEFLNCNKIFNIKNDFLPCPVNQDLKQFINEGEEDYKLIDKHQAEYRLYINGKKVATFVHKGGFGMVIKGTTETIKKSYEVGEVINSVKLAMAYGEFGEEFCSWNYNPDPVQPLNIMLLPECSNGVVVYKVPKLVGGMTIHKISQHPNSAAPLTITDKGSEWEIRSAVNKTGKITVEYGAGHCTVDIDIPAKSCCSDVSTNIKISTSSNGGKHYINIAGAPAHAVTSVSGKTLTGNGKIELAVGQHTYNIVVDPLCDPITGIVNIVEQNSPFIVTPKIQNLCTGQTSQSILVTAGLSPGGQLKYKVNSGQIQTVVLDSNGKHTFPGVTVPTTYEFIELITNGISQLLSETATVNFLSTPTANISGNATIYRGESAELTISGTGGAKVTLSDGTVVVLPAGTGTVTATVTVSPISTTTYTITKVELGDCQGAKTGTATITVQFPILITETHSCNSLGKQVFTFSANPGGGTWKIYADSGKTILLSSTNTVTVDPNLVQKLFVEYTPPSGNKLNPEFDVLPCNCPPITFDAVADPTTICNGGTSVITVSNVVGAVDPVYKYIINGVDNGFEPNNTKAINILQYTTVEVIVKDNSREECVSPSKIISINYDAGIDPDIVTIDPNIDVLSNGNFEACDDVTNVIFSADQTYHSMVWSITNYNGSIQNNNSKNVTVNINNIVGAVAELTLTATTITGCVGTITRTITKKTCNIIQENEFLLITSTGRILKVPLLDPNTLGTPTLLCTNIGTTADIAYTNGNLYAFNGGNSINNRVQILNLDSCTITFIPDSGLVIPDVQNSVPDLGVLSPGVLVYSANTGTGSNKKVALYKYDIASNTHTYMLSLNLLFTNGDGISIGNKYYLGGIISGSSQHIYSFDIVGGMLTNPVDMGTIPMNGYGLVKVTINSVDYVYSFGSDGSTYKVDLTNLANTVQIGTINTGGGIIHGSANIL